MEYILNYNLLTIRDREHPELMRLLDQKEIICLVNTYTDTDYLVKWGFYIQVKVISLIHDVTSYFTYIIM